MRASFGQYVSDAQTASSYLFSSNLFTVEEYEIIKSLWVPRFDRSLIFEVLDSHDSWPSTRKFWAETLPDNQVENDLDYLLDIRMSRAIIWIVNTSGIFNSSSIWNTLEYIFS